MLIKSINHLLNPYLSIYLLIINHLLLNHYDIRKLKVNIYYIIKVNLHSIFVIILESLIVILL